MLLWINFNLYNFNLNKMAQLINSTKTMIKQESDKTEDKKNDDVIAIKAPIFLLFAEYIGFVSGVIDWVEDYINGKTTPDFKMKVIEEDALCLEKKIMKKYTRDEILSWYQSFYDIVLSDYEEKINKLEK